MTTSHVIKDAASGEFVSATYAEANPDTTYVATIAEPDRLTEALDGIEAAGWDWTLYFYRNPERMTAGTHRYELEVWRQPVGYLRLGGPTKRAAAEAVLAALADLPAPAQPEPVEDVLPGDVVPELALDEEVG